MILTLPYKNEFTGTPLFVFYPDELPVFLRSGIPTVIYGMSQTGKSLFSLYLASKFMEDYEEAFGEKVKTLVIDTEMSYLHQIFVNAMNNDLIRRHMQNFIIKTTPSTKDFEKFLGIDIEFEVKIKQTKTGEEKEGKMIMTRCVHSLIAPIEETIQKENVKMLVIDSFSRPLYLRFPATASQNFSARSDWIKIIMGQLQRIAWVYNLAFLIIHHSQKPYLNYPGAGKGHILPMYGGNTLAEFFKIRYYMERDVNRPGKLSNNVYLYYLRDVGYDAQAMKDVKDGVLIATLELNPEQGIFNIKQVKKFEIPKEILAILTPQQRKVVKQGGTKR